MFVLVCIDPDDHLDTTANPVAYDSDHGNLPKEMARRLGERTVLRWGLTPRSYEVTAPTAVGAVWAISRSGRQIIAKAFSASYTDGQTRTEMARVHHRSYTAELLDLPHLLYRYRSSSTSKEYRRTRHGFDPAMKDDG